MMQPALRGGAIPTWQQEIPTLQPSDCASPAAAGQVAPPPAAAVETTYARCRTPAGPHGSLQADQSDHAPTQATTGGGGGVGPPGQVSRTVRLSSVGSVKPDVHP
jgi:hypothetical protein